MSHAAQGLPVGRVRGLRKKASSSSSSSFEALGSSEIETIIDTLQIFLRRVHTRFAGLKRGTKTEIWKAYVEEVDENLLNLERQPACPTRNDGTIFVSLASYRDHMLKNTLLEMYNNAKRPEKIFAGVVQQNCLSQCKTGVQVVSAPGEKPVRTKVSDAPPDVDGVKEFCDVSPSPCRDGRLRVLRVNESESLGPAFARYLASKLWRGEQYFLQIDAHMWFKNQWDFELSDLLQKAPSYPKAVISAYPPGPDDVNWQNKPSSRLCSIEFSSSPVEGRILRLGSTRPMKSPANDPAPPRSVYVAAGFFAAHGSFLHVMPYDPYLPFVFMGEEVHLTARFFTHGWDVYAPRTNLVAHQYRPGKLGLPKFWETTDRTFGGRGVNVNIQSLIIQRIKHVVGYPDAKTPNEATILTKMEESVPNYHLGTSRSLQDFLDFTGINYQSFTAGPVAWCNQGIPPPPSSSAKTRGGGGGGGNFLDITP